MQCALSGVCACYSPGNRVNGIRIEFQKNAAILEKKDLYKGDSLTHQENKNHIEFYTLVRILFQAK